MELKPLVFSINDLAYVDEPAVSKNFQNPHDNAVYKATEVDKLINELTSERDKWKNEAGRWFGRYVVTDSFKKLAIAENENLLLKDSNAGGDILITDLRRSNSYQKYKRCIALMNLCESNFWKYKLEFSFYEYKEKNGEIVDKKSIETCGKKIEHYNKWYCIWSRLAIEFKDGK